MVAVLVAVMTGELCVVYCGWSTGPALWSCPDLYTGSHHPPPQHWDRLGQSLERVHWGTHCTLRHHLTPPNTPHPIHKEPGQEEPVIVRPQEAVCLNLLPNTYVNPSTFNLYMHM